VRAALAIGFALLAFVLGEAAPVRGEGRVVDDFTDVDGWTASASEGSRAWITREPGATGAMRVGFELNAGGGYIIVRKAIALALSDNYAFTFGLRGEGKPNTFEFKLIDPRGRSVWWHRQRNFVFPSERQQVTIRKSRLTLAWGASTELRHIGAIELAVSAGEGGSGSFLVDQLAFEEREPAGPDGPPQVTASTRVAEGDPAYVLEDKGPGWRSEPLPREQWLLLDFGRNREFGGLVIDWDGADWATTYQVEVSNDGTSWTSAFRTTTGRGGRDYIYMPDAESRFVRLVLERSSRGRGYGIAHLALEPVEFSASPNEFFAAIARDAPVGAYPKYLYGRQTYWTVVGVAGDGRNALLNEEGMLEVGRGQFSIEPFLYTDEGLVTWGGVSTEQHLAEEGLPIPSVVWRHPGGLGLTATAFADGTPGASVLYARYRVANRGEHSTPVTLFLAVRPFQVNPPWQTLNVSGGVTHIQDLRLSGHALWVNRDKAVVSLSVPDGFGAATFEDGSITHFLEGGQLPARTEVSDPFGFASGAFRYNFYLEPRGEAEVVLAIPFHEPQLAALTERMGDGAAASVAERERDVRDAWSHRLRRAEFRLPAAAKPIAETIESTLGYILVNRDGPGLRPGSRDYARSWIRDGAMISSALLSLGFTEEPREFIRWFASFQAPDGKIPCCVDGRGPDPVNEHDSAGAFVWAIAEYYRYTRDVGFLSELWPHLVRAVDYLAALRARRTTDEFQTPEKEIFYGILPESISHEGYAAHPVHSYWDDFFALRAFKDAAALALVVGDEEHATRFAGLRDAFRTSLYASIGRAMAKHGIDYLPGSAELGDFDPTSTSIAVVPGGEEANLPAAALARTYERYWRQFAQRRDGMDWLEYSPYEVRNVGVLLRLGHRGEALELLRSILADRRPPGWNEWAEVVWRDADAPRFIGDMPHTWVGASYLSSVRSLFVYERESDAALVLAAGVPAEWVTAEGGVTVKRLPTYYGVLGMTLRAEDGDTVRVRLSGDLAMPPGRLVVRSPLARPLRSVSVNGRAVREFRPDEVVVGEFPADVQLRY
jgi:F5/8 type C domain-containing protein